ncbi:MAG: cytochrome-c3 hydrogenase subunit gamma [Promethearchaeota archaeon]
MEIKNVLAPSPARITKIEEMTEIEKMIHVELLDREFARNFAPEPGQFVELGVQGVGEAPVSICTCHEGSEIVEFVIRKVGRVTNAIHKLSIGDTLWIRGPYGVGFPMEKMEGSNLLLVAGGLGVAPLRGVLQYAILNRKKYKDIAVFYGIRSYDLMLFSDEFSQLLREGEKQGIAFYLSYEDPDDRECNMLETEMPERCTKGVVTKLFELVRVSPENTYAIICGPPIMYKFVIKELMKLNFDPRRIYMTLERRMECGLGKCGHCIMGGANSIKYVCKEGPVFTYWDALNTKGMI